MQTALMHTAMHQLRMDILDMRKRARRLARVLVQVCMRPSGQLARQRLHPSTPSVSVLLPQIDGPSVENILRECQNLIKLFLSSLSG